MIKTEQLINNRKSARRFLPKQVSRADIEHLIMLAGKAPSAINLQPWEYLVTYGDEKNRLIRRLKHTHKIKQATCGPGTSEPLPEKYTNRSRQALKKMKPHVEKAGISFNQFIEEGSCSFYGAPVVIFVLMDSVFPEIRYLDVGISVSYLLLSAEDKGLSTCPIGLITEYSDEIKDALNIPEQKKILLAIALGYADMSDSVNHIQTDREVLKDILSWYE